MTRTRQLLFPILVGALTTVSVVSSAAAFDLAAARVTQLDNGLTLVVLEEPRLPVVSVQALYRVGARHEPVGRTGIAHFLEHMAFRATENFPDTGVVSAIYAVGGEWHGYTWLDQTTYFETLPAAHLDLALRIEADRMARAVIAEADVEPERGAVLGEMHGYDNDPATALKDAVLAVSFLQHPYRNNTIGWESDVEAITHADLVAFYRDHYRPANAVLAVVGRVSAVAVEARVRELFAGLPATGPPAPPPTVEPPQRGVRRVVLEGAGGRSYFEVAYRAPAFGDPDHPAFLLLQEVLAGGRGVNFAQNTFGDPVRPGTRLAGLANDFVGDLVSWYPPQEDPYVLTVAGTVDPASDSAEVEARLEAAIEPLRVTLVDDDELAAARRRLSDELVFDLETTEDAAHQLAYFAGIGALDELLALPRRLESVTAEDIRDAARRYLQPWQRTIGWHLAGDKPRSPVGPGGDAEARAPSPEARSVTAEPIADPEVLHLASGIPVLFERRPLSSSAYLRLLLPGTGLELDAPGVQFALTEDYPVWRHTSLDFRFRPHELEAVLAAAREAVRGGRAGKPVDPETVEDPGRRLALELERAIGEPRGEEGESATSSTTDVGIRAVALVGDLRRDDVMPLLEAALGELTPGAAPHGPGEFSPLERRVALAAVKAQAQLGYVVPAPPLGSPQACAWRTLLYVLSHGYEGRLGKEAISRRGLLYYIAARYSSDGAAGRVSLEMGVDPAKLEPLRTLLRESLAELVARPPSDAEVAEARSHFLGRRISAAQSNQEVSARLLADWVDFGELSGGAELAADSGSCDRAEVRRVAPAFAGGAIVSVEVGR